MIPAPFEYHRATSIPDAVTTLSAGDDDARPLAGGQSLVPLMKLRLARPSLVVDLRGIPELHRMSFAGTSVSVGAMVTHRDVLRELGERTGHPSLTDAASVLGDLQVRSRGTLVGSLTHADPASDWFAVALALDFRLHISGLDGTRTEPVRGLATSAFVTTLHPGEIVTSVDVPLARMGEVSAYAKVADPASGYARAGTAVALVTDGRRTTDARVALTGVAPFPTRLPSVEHALVEGKQPAEAARCALDDIDLDRGIPDRRYRLQLAQVTIRRSVERALERSLDQAPSRVRHNAAEAGDRPPATGRSGATGLG